MKIREYNLKHANAYCPVCKNSEHTRFDHVHGETYCAKCGLVLHDINARKSVVKYMEEARKKELFIRNLWKKRIK